MIKYKMKYFMEAYQRGFKSNVLTVGLYTLLSTFWILGSDTLVRILYSNTTFYERSQSFKGMFFVIMTSIFLLILLWQNYKTIVVSQEAHKKSQDELREFKYETTQRNGLYYLMTRYLIDQDINEDDILADIFGYIFSRVEVCDLGCVFRVERTKVHFISTIGYDLKKLNNLEINPEDVELFTFKIRQRKNDSKGVQSSLSEKFQGFPSLNPAIHESVCMGLSDSEEVRIGISLDISNLVWENQKSTFDEKMIKELSEMQVLLTAMFRMKTMVGVKDLLQKDIVNSFIAALEYHDEYTKGHSESVARIAMEIGRNLDLKQSELQELRWAGMVHDIGKIIIPEKILNKKGSLDDDEYAIVKKHPEIGEHFMSRSESLNDIAKYVRHHHERWDGKGYPDGLKGNEIPLFSRIICVADSFHAMTSDRPYRAGLPKEEALKEMLENRSKQFCPLVVDAFMKSDDEKLGL